MKKIISYIGFARKSNNIIIGQSLLKSSTKQVYLIMLCSTASNNLKDLAHNVANRYDCSIITTDNLDELTNLNGVKIIGITDNNLSKAIIDNWNLEKE